MLNTGKGASRGAMIVLEGLDRSGKTTQSLKLLQYFEEQKISARIQRFPDRDEPMIGPLIDQFLKTAKSVNESQEVIHLLFAANRWAVANKLREELANGTHLIVDRYSFSGIAYSLAKGLDKNWVCQPEIGLLKPDLVLFFDIDPSKTTKRDGQLGIFKEEVMERNDFQQAVYGEMKKIYDNNYWKIIDASASIDKVHSTIVHEVEELLGKRATNEEPLSNFSREDFKI